MTAPTVEPVAAPAAFAYTDLDAIGEESSLALLAWWALRADMDLDQWVSAAAFLLARHVTAARAWGRVRAGLDLTPGQPFYPDPPAPDEDDLLPRLEQAWTTAVEVAEERPDPDATAERLARDEPIAAAQAGYQEVLAEAGVTGYRRALNPDACELCQWLQKSHLAPGGYVYPIDQPMFRHIGCRCLPEPTTDPINPRKDRR